MKAKKSKKNYKEFLSKNAILIKCRYCEKYSTCDKKENKLKNEKNGIRTFCILTPNESKKTLGKMTNKQR